MATPNDSGPVKKPTPSVPPAKAPAPKPAAPGAKPAAGPTPPAKPPAPQPGAKPAAKPTNVRPGAARRQADQRRARAPKPKPAAGGPPAKKPVAKKERGDGSTRGGKRRLGQVLIDLGFIDDDQLWAILDEAKNTGVPTGRWPWPAASSTRTSCSRPWPSRTASRSSTSRRPSRSRRSSGPGPRDDGRRLQDPAAVAQGQGADHRRRRPGQPVGRGRPAQLAQPQRGDRAAGARRRPSPRPRPSSTPARKKASWT